jgi:hypothetical protein
MKRDIQYTVFLKCSVIAVGDFWKGIFEDLACGKTPYGTYISKDFLCCNKKDKEFSYKIDESADPQTVYNEIVDIFTKIHIFNDNDKTYQKIAEYNELIRTQLMVSDWNSIRIKSDKDMFLEKFVIEMKHKYKLSYKQSYLLLNLIYIGLVFKIISNTDIDYNNMKINGISGLTFTQGNYTFDKNIFGSKKVLSEVIEKKYMSNNWLKYVSMCDKKSM